MVTVAVAIGLREPANNLSIGSIKFTIERQTATAAASLPTDWSAFDLYAVACGCSTPWAASDC